MKLSYTNREFRINNFDLLRLFAAYEVLLLHSYSHLGIAYPSYFKIMSNFPGVSMFFAMSGFLISGSFERNKNLKTYFRNRSLRIYPALWACLVLTVPVIYLSSGISFFNSQSIPWFISQCAGFIYTPSFLSSFGFGSYNGSLWTIPLELQFYIILPVLYFVICKITRSESKISLLFLLSFIIFFILTVVIKVHFDKNDFEAANTPKILRYTFIPNIYLFLLGVVLQRFKIYESNLIFGRGLFWLLLYLLINNIIPTSNLSFAFKLCFLGLTTISLAYTLPTLSKRVLKGHDISYGIYIYHGLVLGTFIQLKLPGNGIYVGLIFIITTVLASFSWIFIERPFLNKKKRAILTSGELSFNKL